MTEEAKAPAYFGNEMNAFNEGVQQSIQFRIAFEFLKVDMTIPRDSLSAAQRVEHCYVLAEEFVTQGQARGLLKPISDSHECNAQTKKMIDRNTSAQSVLVPHQDWHWFESSLSIHLSLSRSSITGQWSHSNSRAQRVHVQVSVVADVVLG